MTREDLRAMEIRIGREMFGIESGILDIEYCVPAYGAGMLLAEPLATRLRALGWLVVLKWIPEGFPFLGDPRDGHVYPVAAACELHWMGRLKDPKMPWLGRPTALAETMPEALVKAAIQALDAMQKHGVPLRTEEQP